MIARARRRAGADRPRPRPAPRLPSGFGLSVGLLVLLIGLRAEAEAATFDQVLAAQVFTAAFTFMAPRTLNPVTVPLLTEWGLRGITALDAGLTPAIAGGQVTLQGPRRVLIALPAPSADDVAGWGAVIASVNAVAWRHSPLLRRAGTQGVISSFFDEVFNHLDPYSRYVAPGAAEQDRDWRHGAAGIGVLLADGGGRVVITGVIPQSPAARAGLHPGEFIVAVDGTRSSGSNAVRARLNGVEGVPVAVTLRARAGRPWTVSLVRAEVPADTIAASMNAGLLLVQVSGFTGSTSDLLRQTILAAMSHAPEPHGLVLDLRGNRGGLLRQAVDVANLVLNQGVIVTTEGRDPEADHRWSASGPDLADGLPIVVLVDGRTASAAEVLAAALSDRGRAVVVGSTTLGKGLVQTIGPMPDGGELFVTWSRVLAPDGWPLQGLGMMPEVCTSLGALTTQAQLAALDDGHQLMAKVLALHRRATPDTPLAEVLTIRNECPADLGHDSDLDAARFLIANPVAYASALAPL